MKEYIEKYIEKHPIPPKIEKVDKFEVYLLDENNERIRQICGAKKRGYPDGYVCLSSAGRGTSHKGWGYCDSHEKKKGRSYYMDMEKLQQKLEKKGKKLFPSVEEGMELAEIVEDKMDDLSLQVKILMGVLFSILTEEEKDLDSNTIYKIMDLLKEIRNQKESHYKIKKDASLDLRVISAFVDRIFTIISQSLELAQARSIMERIRKDAILPISGMEEGGSGEFLEKGVEKSIDDTSEEAIFSEIDKKEEEKGDEA